MDLQQLQTRLHEALQQPKNEQSWKGLLQLLAPFYPDEYDERRPKKAEQEQVEREVMPSIEQELARWPDWLRVAQITSHPRVKRLAKVLRISFHGSGMKQFGALHGKKVNLISKKMIAELLPLWMGPERYDGFLLDYVDRCHWPLLEALLKANGALRYLYWSGVNVPIQSTPYRRKPEEIEDMMLRLIEASGQTLERFGISMSRTERDDNKPFYQPLIDHAERLPALRSLGFPGAPLFDADIFLELIARPAFDRLQELTFTSDLHPARGEALMQRAASLNLRRIGVGYMNFFNQKTKLDPRALIAAPNLAGVEAWDLRTNRRDDESWETEEAALWATEKSGRDHASVLEREVVDLDKHDAAQARDALLDGGRLLPSTKLKALRLYKIDDGLLGELIASAHLAWPNLECLVFMRGMETQELHDRWVASPLMGQLKFLTWEPYRDPERAQLRAQSGDPKAQMNTKLALIAKALDETVHPFLAYRLWQTVRWEITPVSEQPKIAKALGVPKPLPTDSYQLMEVCEARLIELRGGKQRMLLDGPTYATSQDNFSWP